MTRDIREGVAQLGALCFDVLDTAGHEAGEGLAAELRGRAVTAIERSDAVLFLIDARVGVTAMDRDLADALRRTGRHVVPVANKVESRVGEQGLHEIWELGFGEPIAVSAEHRLGLGELEDAIAPVLAAAREREAKVASEQRAAIRVAVFGRPNVGKSTLVNTLLGASRVVVGPEAGLTRDAVMIPFERGGQAYELVDTAGLRRRAGARTAMERIAAEDALRALRFAEIAVLLIDARSPFEQQDLRLADHAEGEGRAVVIGVNKWDLVREGSRRRSALAERANRLLPGLAGVAVKPVSGLRGQGLDALLDAACATHATWCRRVGTGLLNRWLAGEVDRHPPRAVRGRRIRLRYIAQTNVRPPTFALFASRPAELDAAYRRFLVNGIRRRFDFPGVPIRLMVRGGENPYAGRR